jgi:hypothetical protein
VIRPRAQCHAEKIDVIDASAAWIDWIGQAYDGPQPFDRPCCVRSEKPSSPSRGSVLDELIRLDQILFSDKDRGGVEARSQLCEITRSRNNCHDGG